MNENWVWSSRLVTIFTTYASALLPIALFVIWIRRKNARGDFTPRTAFSRFMESFALGANNYAISIPTKEHLKSTEKSFKSDCFWLLFLSLGVTVPLWLMGLLQERIVTHPYKRLEDPAVEEYFHDMQFLVFSNRLFGFLLSGCLLFVTRRSQPIHVPPYYMHSFTSIANIMASWCQYSALQFVTFPTMTIAKVSKVVGTMIMGTVLRGKQYSLSEYFTAGGIAFGAGLFLVHTVPNHSQITSTTISGFILIAGYLIFDSFTANWQKALFNTKPKISKGQMMFGVNVFSVLLSVFSLLEQGSFLPAIDFALNHENFVRHNALMSLAAAISQLFIYATIDRFGPVTLSVMMTIRQIGSILLSVVAFGHQIPAIASLGLFITFGCLFLDIYLRYFKNSPHRCLN